VSENVGEDKESSLMKEILVLLWVLYLWTKWKMWRECNDKCCRVKWRMAWEMSWDLLQKSC